MIHARALLFAGSLSLAASAQAAAIAVVNPGFEDTTGLNGPTNEFFFGQPIGWDFYDPNTLIGNGAGSNGIFTGTLEPNGVDFFNTTAPEGDLVGILFGFGDQPSAGAGEYGIEQTLAAVLQANTTYELSVEVGNIGSGTGLSGDFFDLSGFLGYRVELLAGNTTIAVDDNTLVIPEAEFATSTVSFTTGGAPALLGQNLGIRLVNVNGPPGGDDPNIDVEVDFDNVRLSATPVPAPTTLALLALGLAGIGFSRRSEST